MSVRRIVSRGIFVLSTALALLIGLLAAPIAGAFASVRFTTAQQSKAISMTSPVMGSSSLPSLPSTTSLGLPAGVHLIGELPALRTTTSRTYVTASGTRVVVAYPGPVNYRDASGKLVPIDDTAVAASGGGWHNAANEVTTFLPATIVGSVSVTTGSGSLGFQLSGSLSSSGSASPFLTSPTSSPTTLTPTALTSTATTSTASSSGSLSSSLTAASAVAGQATGNTVTYCRATYSMPSNASKTPMSVMTL